MMRYAGLIVFAAADLERSRALFTALLGTEPYADSPYYVGFRTDGLEVGLDPNAQGRGPIAYWETEDIAAAVAELTAAGASADGEPRDVGGGMLVTTVTDPSGNVIGRRQPPA